MECSVALEQLLQAGGCCCCWRFVAGLDWALAG